MVYQNNAFRHSSLYDRVEKLLLSYEWSDCKFTVAGRHFKAHKLILGISSPVFEAMFYGPLSTNEEIAITDIEPDIFQLLLNYVYTDKVEIPSIEQAFELLYASRKYLLEHLSDLCIAYILANISTDNVIRVLNYPDYMQDQQLVSFALKLFCEHANYLLQEHKNMISCSCMKTILESDQMNISEKSLIIHVFQWTLHYCKQNNLPEDLKSRHNILIENDFLKLLRFSALTISEFEEIIESKDNILLPEESKDIGAIIKKIKNDDEHLLNVNSLWSIPRSPIKLQWDLCHRRPLRSAAPIVIDSNNSVINSRVKVNKSVFINSLCIPTRMAPVLNFRNNIGNSYSEQFFVTVECESDKSITKLTNFMNTVDYDSSVEIELSEPYFIKKDKWYKIIFQWSQTFDAITYVVEYRDRVFSDHKVSFEFDDMPSSARVSGSFLGGLKYCL
ncbi:BTB/POZ domain-containing protein 6-B-like [Cydia fagiglandana]|uniref:BTB/POZ domain-containing protein 6-B-like n=1 Tax=Cydia fagiglandana TaxID=1458189 RepID=UPI002FEE0397